MNNLNFNKKNARKYIYNKKKSKIKRYNKKINIGIMIFLCIILGIFIGQVIMNKKNDAQNTQAASVNEKENTKVEAAIGSEGKDGKKEDKQPKQEEPIRKDVNVSKEGDKFTFSASEAQKIVKNKGIKDGKKVAFLTFDDGPSVKVTPKILDTLKNYDVKATFFIIGENLTKGEKNKELLKREFEEGHAIANHTYSHDMNKLYPGRKVNVDYFMQEIEQCNNEIRNVLGESFNTKVIRMPGGYNSREYYKDPNLQALDAKLKENNIVEIDWNALNKDAEGKPKNADQLLNEIKDSVKGKEKVVILMHDIKERTAEALPSIIEYLKAEGYEFRTLK